MHNITPKIKAAVTIIFLLLTLVWLPFGLVGVVLVLFWTKWPTWLKILITVPLGALFTLLILSTSAVFTFLFFVRPFQMKGISMAPNYREGMYLMTTVVRPNNITVSRGDVIIFRSLNNPNTNYIQRVIGQPGESIMIKSSDVYVNSRKIDESNYLPIGTKTEASQFMTEEQTINIPPGKYFTLGDNRQHASDSRVWGFLPQENIISKVAFCYWNCSNK